ncbi:SUI1 domain-containing protein [Plasmodiophora brassicae]|uniref:SUI1 domain-containing protein n=1 Tax=Plasmodiophora brassicae TaxID=37360 RepID=A0A3P3YM71_PLABS|nr:unnamed protein product [Plasmodiophora brassicae]
MTDTDRACLGQTIQYCGACTMPLEYCEFSPTLETKCRAWRAAHRTDALSDGVQDLAIADRSEPATDKPPASAGSASAAPAEKRPADKAQGTRVLVSRLVRKNKTVTVVQNVADEKKVAKALASRFACGASILKGPPPGIYIQGDVVDDVPQFLVDKFNLAEDAVLFFDPKKNKTSPAF